MQQEADEVTRPQVRILPAPPLWYFIKIIIFAVADILYLLPHALESELPRRQTCLENSGLGETSGVRVLHSPPIGFYSKLIEKVWNLLYLSVIFKA